MYIGKGLCLRVEASDPVVELTDWKPSWHSESLPYLLCAIQCYLTNENPQIASQLNKIILKKWFKIVFSHYKKINNNDPLPFTSLDWAVCFALQYRWQTRKRSMIFLRGILRRIKALESEWFENSIEESIKRKAIYACLLVHALAWVNLPIEELLPKDIPQFQYIFGYFSDRRHWDRNPGRELIMPRYFSEIAKAYASDPGLSEIFPLLE